MSTERQESVEEVDSGAFDANITSESLQKSHHHHHHNNNIVYNSMRQYPSSSMVHNATNAFKKDYKRKSADAAVPNRIKQSPSLNMGAAVAMARNDDSNNSRPSSADIKSTSSLVKHERSVSSVSLPDVYREHYRNGGSSSLAGSDRYNEVSQLPTINNSDSDTNSDTLSIISSTSSKTSKKKHSFRFFNKIKTKLK